MANIQSSELPTLQSLAGLESAVPRSVSGTYHLNGDDAMLWSAGETPADPFEMTAPAGDYRYAIYGGYPVNGVSWPLTLVLNLEGSAGTVWVGLSNYTKGHWEWHSVEAPFSTWMEVTVPTTNDEYFNDSGHFYFCLLAYDGDTLHFEGANIYTMNHWLIYPDSWQDHLIAAGADVGKHHAACLLADDQPAVVYTDDNLERIRFAVADSANPTSSEDWTTHVADSGSDRGGTLDICLSSGVPAIVYEDINRQDVYYACSGIAVPTQESDWIKHQPNSDAQAKPRLANLNGEDYILFRGIGRLAIAHALVAHPADGHDWTVVTVDSGASSYDYLQLAMHPDGPVAAYKRLEGGPAYLYYAWSDAINGGNLLDFNTVLVDETNTNNGNNVQLVLGGDNRAWIAYTNVDIVHYMRFASANITNPTTATHFTKCDVFGQEQTHTGQYMGLGRFADRPLFSFIETGSGSIDGIHAIYPNRDLNYATTEAFDYTLLYEPSATELVNEETEVLTLANGYPAIIFRTTEGLHFYCFPASAAP